MSDHFTSFVDFKRRYPIRPHDERMSLGSGSYGKVVKVEDQLETEWVAIKISEFKGTESKSLREEIQLAQKIPRQANIARYDACYRFETDTSLCDFAVMKYYQDGNLATLLKNERLSPAQIYDLTRGILLGLQHLHKHRIVHRDFKPANILISRDNEGRLVPKIADFGLSKLVDNEEIDSSDFDLSDGRGTPSYKAPEQIEGSRVSFNLDLWAFGVILYEIMTGEKPFQVDMRSGSEQSIRRSIELKIMSVQLPDRINSIAEPYQRILKRCLVRDIHQRARKEAELLDLLDQIPQRLAEARQSELRGDYELARTQYEDLLRHSPDNKAATDGLARCIVQNRPVDVPTNPSPNVPNYAEPTDAFPHHEAAQHPADLPTDVFVSTKANASAVDTLPQPTARQSKPLPWQYLIPAAVVLAGWGAFTIWRSNNTTSTGKDTRVVHTAGLDAVTLLKPVTTSSRNEAARPVRTLAPDAPTVVQLVGFMRAKGAGKEANRLLAIWNQAAHNGAEAEQKAAIAQVRRASKQYGFRESIDESVVTVPTTVTQAAGNAIVPAPPPVVNEPVAEKTAAKTDEPDPVSPKQAAQQEYDQLIDKGAAAISAKNDKAAAIALFTEAHKLASKQDLNTAKGREKYALYLGRGSRIMENEEYEGAKQWLLVAQSLDNTADVRAKIKRCSID